MQDEISREEDDLSTRWSWQPESEPPANDTLGIKQTNQMPTGNAVQTEGGHGVHTYRPNKCQRMEASSWGQGARWGAGCSPGAWDKQSRIALPRQISFS